jgi:hypothetical protein
MNSRANYSVNIPATKIVASDSVTIPASKSVLQKVKSSALPRTIPFISRTNSFIPRTTLSSSKV